MAQSSRSLFRRIRCVKSSLENAEQSFLDNKKIRGELDLMLAEAELQNLRRQKDVPWSWNRQLLAAGAAALFALAGFGGWYCARDHYVQRQSAAAAVGTGSAEPAFAPQPAAAVPTANIKNTAKNSPAAEEKPPKRQVTISRTDLHRLVQSARVELSNSK